MPAPSPPDPLPVVLDELRSLGDQADRDVIAGLQDRLRASRLRVLIAGEAKRGKSTLVNALLGRDVLPTGATPLTALATTVRHGHDEGVTATLAGGASERFPLAALAELVTERGNPGNQRGLASVSVALDCPLLARGVELVDTPGTGSVYEHNTAQARAALTSMDAAVVVLTADPPASASERELMAEVARLSVAMFVVLNKADYLAGTGQLAEALNFTAEVVAAAVGRPMRIYPMSARAALSPDGDAGFAAFADDFGSYLDSGRVSGLRRSIAGHCARLANAMRDQVLLTRQVAQMRSQEAAGRVAEFGARLAAVGEHRRDAADLAAGESARMLADLNAAAELAARESTALVMTRLDALLDGRLRSAAAAEIERTARESLGQFAVEAAESWRRDQAERLEGALARLDGRLTDGLRRELLAVRAAAAELLGIELAVVAPGRRLAPDIRFFYSAVDEAGQTELLAGAIRRRLPGEAGRRRARAHLRGEAASLAPRQIGRARADLQCRLAEAARRLVREVLARYDEGTGRLEKALLDAGGLASAASAQAAHLARGLDDRIARLDHVLESLDAAFAVPAVQVVEVEPDGA